MLPSLQNMSASPFLMVPLCCGVQGVLRGTPTKLSDPLKIDRQLRLPFLKGGLSGEVNGSWDSVACQEPHRCKGFGAFGA